VASARFGVAAVVDYRGVGYPRSAPWKGYTQVVLVDGGRDGWIAPTTVTYADREVRTRPPRSVGPFARAVRAFHTAIARGNCSVAYDYTVAGTPRERYCKSVVSSRATEHRVIAGNPPLRLEPLGGTANVQFFRSILRIPDRVARKGRTEYVTIPVVHTTRQARAHGASNPYLVGTLYQAPTPPAVAAQGPYTRRVRAAYVEGCRADRARCGCEIETIAAAVQGADFRRRTARFDRLLPGIRATCRLAQRAGASGDERAVARVALGRDLVPGYLCSPDVSTDYVIVALGGSRFACARRLGAAAPDRTVTLTRVSVRGPRATASGTDEDGAFTLKLVRRRGRWLVADFG
jgi:hypothetical protein